MSTNILIFPFYVERFDDMQGVYGRQIPHVLADYLNAASLQTEALSWFVRRAEHVAHVCVEAPFPQNVIEEEAQARGAEHILLGRVRVAPEDTQLQIAYVAYPEEGAEPTREVLFDARDAMHALPALVQNAAEVLLARFATSSHSPLVHSNAMVGDEDTNDANIFSAWRDELVARDARALESEGLP